MFAIGSRLSCVVVLLYLQRVCAFPGMGPASISQTQEHNMKRQTLDIPPIQILGLPNPIHITLPGVVTVGRKIIPDAAHPFREPSASDQRGGCPGLNLLANYGYIDRSGITNLGELLYAQQEMLGFAPDLAAFLTALSLKGMLDVTTLKMSIGLTDKRTSGPLSFLFGDAPGLFSAQSHGKYEVDGSMAFTDAYFAPGHVGNQFNSTIWKKHVDIAKANGGLFDIKFNADTRYEAYKECVSKNPKCTWLLPEQIVFYGGDTFTYSIMPSTRPDGTQEPATEGVVNTFIGAHDNGDGTFTKVAELVPRGSTGPWFRRGVPLTLAEVVLAAVASYSRHPVAFGANSNGVNTFLVSGPQLHGDVTVEHVVCLVLETLASETPTAVGQVVNALVSGIQSTFNCR